MSRSLHIHCAFKDRSLLTASYLKVQLDGVIGGSPVSKAQGYQVSAPMAFSCTLSCTMVSGYPLDWLLVWSSISNRTVPEELAALTVSKALSIHMGDTMEETVQLSAVELGSLRE
jgi:hypothetical protein